MNDMLKKESMYCGDLGLYVNEDGHLIDPIHGQEVTGIYSGNHDGFDHLPGVLDTEKK